MAAQIPAAAGYPQYSGSDMMRPIFSDMYLEEFRCRSFLDELTDGVSFLGELQSCGDTIVYPYAPTATVRPYVKNQKLEDDFVETKSRSLTIGKAHYFSVKMDHIDIKQICSSATLLDHYTKSAREIAKRKIEGEFLAYAMGVAAPYNMGAKAGKVSGSYNLGVMAEGGLRPITSADILQWLTDIASVLLEACVFDPTPNGSVELNGARNDLAILLPTQAWGILMNSPLANAAFMGTGTSQLLTGRLPQAVQGFHLYFSNNIPAQMIGGQRGYPVMAMRRDAFAAVTQLDELRTVDNMSEYFGRKIQGLQVYDFMNLYPETVAMSAVTFG